MSFDQPVRRSVSDHGQSLGNSAFALHIQRTDFRRSSSHHDLPRVDTANFKAVLRQIQSYPKDLHADPAA
ncbi:MAG: hypothetical protein EOS23_32990 [Mesorhizobium sp.]|uniref:hypothetical protein n=1 Tax=Mesorhizobium sp. TaxID=1871066 RepID=UPI000FE45F8D|nr:hypothetical protein [Mesorhizobium sp.]RWE05595.1 MAG: hypothetical protein EOS23_32990 [Mesorhizobium sp.]TIV76953.1 MAG: hypothetical protein E5V64_32155 [Mesorhizobium sp.]